MRTNVEVDEELISEIIRLGEAKNKKMAIEKAIIDYSRYLHKLSLLELFGKIKWEGNLEEMRSI